MVFPFLLLQLSELVGLFSSKDANDNIEVLVDPDAKRNNQNLNSK